MGEHRFEQVNECLNRLQFILKKIGVVEFTVSENKRRVNWETSLDLDTALLDDFCTQLGNVYNTAINKDLPAMEEGLSL